MDCVNRTALSVEQKDYTRRGIDVHALTQGSIYCASQRRRQATKPLSVPFVHQIVIFGFLRQLCEQNTAKDRFFTSQLQALLCQENKCKRKPSHIQVHVEFQGMENLCETQNPCLHS